MSDKVRDRLAVVGGVISAILFLWQVTIFGLLYPELSSVDVVRLKWPWIAQFLIVGAASCKVLMF